MGWVDAEVDENGYFDVFGNPFRSGDLNHGKGCNQIRTACLNFARDRPDLMRVCSNCILRGICERAYVKPREDEGGQTVDVMRFVLTYGLHRLNDSLDSEPLINKRIQEAIRSLIRDMVKFSKEKLDFDPSKRVQTVQKSKNSCDFHERIETS
ncbi:unnamed protein product [Lactuca virosa]|uniref:DNA-directed RNA polymerase n=1 Tax=Lactuca virosa TaxID=75947 RepID=A0AAU9PQL1_9ASTR|nr:unnamed protein product [Lactuca virosa]